MGFIEKKSVDIDRYYVDIDRYYGDRNYFFKLTHLLALNEIQYLYKNEYFHIICSYV